MFGTITLGHSKADERAHCAWTDGGLVRTCASWFFNLVACIAMFWDQSICGAVRSVQRVCWFESGAQQRFAWLHTNFTRVGKEWKEQEVSNWRGRKWGLGELCWTTAKAYWHGVKDSLCTPVLVKAIQDSMLICQSPHCVWVSKHSYGLQQHFSTDFFFILGEDAKSAFADSEQHHIPRSETSVSWPSLIWCGAIVGFDDCQWRSHSCSWRRCAVSTEF